MRPLGFGAGFGMRPLGFSMRPLGFGMRCGMCFMSNRDFRHQISELFQGDGYISLHKAKNAFLYSNYT